MNGNKSYKVEQTLEDAGLIKQFKQFDHLTDITNITQSGMYTTLCNKTAHLQYFFNIFDLNFNSKKV